MPRSRAAAGGAGPVGGGVGRRVDAGVAQGGDVLEGEQVVVGFDQGGAQFRAPLADRGLEHGLQRAVLAQQLGRGLRPDALGAGQAVGGIAAQGDEVGDQLGPDPVALAHLLRPDLFGAFAAGPHVEDGHPVAGALVHVAVAGHQQRLAAGRRLALPRRSRADRRPRGRRWSPPSSANASKKSRACVELGRQLRRHFLLAFGVVGGVELGPVGGRVGAEAEHDRPRPVRFDLAQDQVGRPQQRVHRLPVGPTILLGSA